MSFRSEIFGFLKIFIMLQKEFLIALGALLISVLRFPKYSFCKFCAESNVFLMSSKNKFLYEFKKLIEILLSEFKLFIKSKKKIHK